MSGGAVVLRAIASAAMLSCGFALLVSCGGGDCGGTPLSAKALATESERRSNEIDAVKASLRRTPERDLEVIGVIRHELVVVDPGFWNHRGRFTRKDTSNRLRSVWRTVFVRYHPENPDPIVTIAINQAELVW